MRCYCRDEAQLVTKSRILCLLIINLYLEYNSRNLKEAHNGLKDHFLFNLLGINLSLNDEQNVKKCFQIRKKNWLYVSCLKEHANLQTGTSKA